MPPAGFSLLLPETRALRLMFDFGWVAKVDVPAAVLAGN
jgi:hypothetical protein